MRAISRGAALALTLAIGTTGAEAHGGGSFVYVPIYVGGGGPVPVPAAKTGDYSNIKTVAVISSIGQKLTLGTTALFAKHRDIDIAEWNLDQTVESTVAGHLRSRFAVKDIPHDRARLAAIPNNHFDTNSAKPVHDYLAALPANGVDAFVVIRADSEGGTSPTGGLSFDNSQAFFTHPVEVANYEIDIIDAHSLAVIGHALSRVAMRQGVSPSFAAFNAPGDLNLSASDTPTPFQMGELRNGYARLLAASLRETLRSLNLGLALPMAGERNLVPIPPENNPLKKVHSVAIVSAVGDHIDVDHRGTFFRHQQGAVPVSDWGLDNEIEAKLASALDKRLVVKSVPADRAKLSNLDIAIRADGLNALVEGLSPAPDIDAYILVLKHRGNVPGVLDPVYGLGVWDQDGFGFRNTAIFASYTIAIVDPHTMKLVWIQRGVTSPTFANEIPYRTIDLADLPAAGAAPTTVQASHLHQAYLEMMDDSLRETLLRMALTGMMAAPVPGSIELPPRNGTGPEAPADASAPTAAEAVPQ